MRALGGVNESPIPVLSTSMYNFILLFFSGVHIELGDFGQWDL